MLLTPKHKSIACLFKDDFWEINRQGVAQSKSGNSDEIKIAELENKITEFQKILLHQHIEQYQDLKAILKPEQVEPMNILFKGLFVCKPSCEHTGEDCSANHK